jgi:tol-pal system protein YbgF
VLRKIFLFVMVYTLSINTYSEESDVLMRMYERLEMIRIQMQQLTEENQQLNNKISNLQDQQDRLYQDLAKKIQLLQNNLGKNKKTDSKLIIPKKNNTEKKIDDSLSGNKKIVSSTEKENLAFIKENPNKETEKKKLVDILPEEENELDLAKKYTNDNFKNKLSEYQLLNEIELYRSAFQQVKDKKYNDSIDTFNAFLYLFPQSNYASNAQYWLSESIYALGDFSNAMINFAKVVEKYPNSSKIADAKLKIGYCYYSIKKWKEARFIFSNIIKKYPNTSLSQLADKKIKSMDVEGR